MAKESEQELKQSFPRELLEQSPIARLTYFKSYTVKHPLLEQADILVWNALREPAGALLIFVIGPTGVGKTTLLEHIQQKLIEQARARLTVDRDHVPPRLVGDAATLQRSWEQVLKYRQPAAILIDEAQHFAKTTGGSRLEDQLDHLKSLAIATQTVHVLAGTYDLLAFRNLSPQLSRRSIDVHFSRYRSTDKEERLAFQKVLLSFQRHLPLEEAPDLVHQWRYCYARTIGCVGVLKDWLTKALAEAPETGAKTITPVILEHHASKPDRCDQMITDIEEGEKALYVDAQAHERLLARLGLSTRRTGQAKDTQEGDKPDPTPPSRRSRIGQRNPIRDAVKKEEGMDGESSVG